MRTTRLTGALLGSVMALAAGLFLASQVPPALGYIDVPPHTLGHQCNYSSNIAVLQVESIHKDKKAVVFRQIKVLKGEWSAETVRHFVVSAETEPILAWAKPGKTAVTFFVKTDHHAGYTYIDGFWYVNRLFIIDSKVINDMGKWQAYMARPSQLRTFSGTPEELVTAITAILKGKEVIVPCMVADKIDDLAAGRGKVKPMRASLKRLDYNPRRDAAE